MSLGLERFVAAARSYCAFFADAPATQRAETAARLLAELVAAAILLEDVQPDSSDAESPNGAVPPVPSFEARYYSDIADPLVLENSAHVVGDLSDDLADIYADIKAGLDAFDQGRVNDALWQWRFDFETHWGEHATDALRVLYALLVNERRRA